MPSACLIDASPYIFRAFFSLPESIVDSEGRPVNAVRGFADFLLKLLRELEPSHLAVTFDGSLTTSFRNEIYPPYKAQRELPPAALEAQLAACRELAAALGCATFIDRRYEADDLIATLCTRLAAEGYGALVVSSDKDLCQLVSEDVTLLDYARGKRFGPLEVAEKFGVRPDQIVDLLALAGDPVDNIPGVRGVGRKTAAALLAEFRDLTEVYDKLARVPDLPLRGASAIAARLQAGRELAFCSRQLAVLALDAPIEWSGLEDLRFLGIEPAAAGRLLARLGMSGLARRLPAPGP